MNAESKPIGPTPERLAKAGDLVEAFTPDKNENYKAVRLLDGSILDFLLNRGSIKGEEYAAGVMLCKDHAIANSGNSGVIDPEKIRVDGGRVDHVTDIRLDAETRYKAALEGVGRPHRDYLEAVVVHGESLESIGRRAHRHKSEKLARNAATASIRDALIALDYFYHGRRNMGHRSSHAPDYKPRILGNGEGENE